MHSVFGVYTFYIESIYVKNFMTIWLHMRKVLVYLPEEVVLGLDEMAKDQWTTRSECIRNILAEATEKYRKEIRGDNKNFFDLLDVDDS